MPQATNRTCAWCGEPATRFTIRPGESPAYQEWCAAHAPEGSREMPTDEPSAAKSAGECAIPDDQPIDLSDVEGWSLDERDLPDTP